jgi:hypothetical protein
MKSKATRRFWRCYENLPKHAQALATGCYEIWSKNHQHPSLHFKKLNGGGDRFSVRIGNHYRAIGHFGRRYRRMGLDRNTRRIQQVDRIITK